MGCDRQERQDRIVAEANAEELAAEEEDLAAMAAAHIVEFCASLDSKMGQKRYERHGCVVTRLTLDHDMTTPKGLAFAEKAVRENPGSLLWGSLPCTAGCTWNFINEQRPGGRRRVKRHRALFRKLLKHFMKVARLNLSLNGEIAFEWPPADAICGRTVKSKP